MLNYCQPAKAGTGNRLDAYAVRVAYLLPDEHVVHHGESREEDAERDEDPRDDRRRRLEVDQREEDHSCNKS